MTIVTIASCDQWGSGWDDGQARNVHDVQQQVQTWSTLSFYSYFYLKLGNATWGRKIPSAPGRWRPKFRTNSSSIPHISSNIPRPFLNCLMTVTNDYSESVIKFPTPGVELNKTLQLYNCIKIGYFRFWYGATIKEPVASVKKTDMLHFTPKLFNVVSIHFTPLGYAYQNELVKVNEQTYPPTHW